MALPLASADPVKLFREDWAETPAALPITQEHVASAALQLNLYGGAVHGLKKSHHPEIENDPHYVWSGEIDSDQWGATLSFHDGTSFDLSGDAYLTWRTRQSGEGHCMRILLRAVGGQWYVSEAVDCPTDQWQVTTHVFSELEWGLLHGDSFAFADAEPTESPDLSAIVEVGFTDLKAGESSPQSCRMDWIEVWGAYRPPLCKMVALTGGNFVCRYNAEMSNDGMLGTRWFAEGDGQWLKAELETTALVEVIEIAWWKGQERIAAFEVQASVDGENWVTALPPTSSDGLTRDFETYVLPEGIEAKFIKFIGHMNTANDWNAINEWRVRGEPVGGEWFEKYPLVEGWRNVTWFGYIYADAHPWILHTGLGWLYAMCPEDGQLFLWDSALGWLWTSNDYYPYLTAIETGKWYMFYQGPDPRWFYNLTDDQWETN